MELETTYGAHNYHPIPVVISKAKGVFVWDPEGKKYIDMLSCYSALNQGHRHPKIVKAAKEQMGLVTLTSRAFHNNKLGPFLKKLTQVAGMEMALPMNTGAEAVEQPSADESPNDSEKNVQDQSLATFVNELAADEPGD